MGEVQGQPKILVVDTDPLSVSSLQAELQRAGFETVEATSFQAAKDLLKTLRPTVMIADVRLGAFNGLHLFLRGRMQQPDLVGIVTSSIPDAVLQTETSRLGGTFLVKPLNLSEVLALISQASRSRQAPAVALADNFVERRIARRRQVITPPRFAPERRVADRRH
jgi:DNA-binding response OmpR family regulator